ncbi:conserved hypothetical integral membrane protein [Amphibacillus marinus]|uniref:Conserved hypothetical integral membrane protein n=1 Tax=Amphibacillus marinus TaxID=872970 RepID=A0A1H8LM85_9BACI|nr:putative sulfate exporter family transporter [Amphibacillus marinus]SEO06274.1 conserved hypothetical integral membrane protein [Amphibacillus marinus]
MINKTSNYIPGVMLAVAIAFVASMTATYLPVHIISATVLALLLGMLINAVCEPKQPFVSGIRFTSKKLLKFAIILLGASLNMTTIIQVGGRSLIVLAFTLFTCFGIGAILRKVFKLNWKLSNLISTGAAICGGSAIAAVAPVIEAEDRDIAYALTVTFMFDMGMIILFPIIGKLTGLTDTAFGLWAGTAVNDTSSVVAAGYAFSEVAGDFAVTVKLIRTLFIIPTVIVFAVIHSYQKKDLAQKQSPKMASMVKAIFPWFIVGFLVLAILNSASLIPSAVSDALKELSRFIMVAALAAIGLSTRFKDIKQLGVKPLLYSLTLSSLVVVVALLVISLQ